MALMQTLESFDKKSFTFNQEHARYTKRRLLALNRASSLRLFDLGVLSHPCHVNEREIRSYFSYENSPLFDESGLLNTSYEMLYFASLTEKDEEVLTILRELMVCRRTQSEMDLLDKAFIKNDMASARYNRKVSIPAKTARNVLKSSGKYPAHASTLAALKEVDPATEQVLLVSVNSAYRKAVLDSLKVPTELWSTDGVLVAGVTREEEERLLPLILGASIPLNGSHGHLLKEYLLAHRKESNLGILQQISFKESHLLYTHLSTFVEQVVSTHGDNVITFGEEGAFLRAPLTSREVVTGAYAWNHQTEDFIEGEHIHKDGLGVTGEFVPLEGQKHYPVPLDIKLSGDKPELVLDIFNAGLDLDFLSPLDVKKFTLTFGEPAYPEEETLGSDLASVLRRGINNFEVLCEPVLLIDLVQVGGDEALRKELACFTTQQ